MAVKITSACRSRNCDRTRSEAGAREGAGITPPQPEPFLAPGQASYISPPGVSPCGASSAGRGPLFPYLGRGPKLGQGSSHSLRRARAGLPGFRFPALALPQPQKPTHRHHNKGGDATATPGWEDQGSTVGLAVSPLAGRRARPPVLACTARELAAGGNGGVLSGATHSHQATGRAPPS